MEVKKNNKFFTIYSSLTSQEKMEFCEFLKLSFINKPRLSELIINRIQSGKDLHLYLSGKYSPRTLWNIYSELTRSLEQFLSVKELMHNEKEMHKLKRIQFSKRGHRKLLNNEFKNEIKNLKETEFSYHTLSNIHIAANNYVSELIKDGISKDFYEINKLNSDFQILRSFFEMLSYNIETETRKEFYEIGPELLQNKIIEIIDYEKILKIINDGYPEFKVFFNIIYYMHCSLQDPWNYENFKKAKDEFLLNAGKCTLDYRSEVYIALLNICNIISNRTKRNMNPDMFEILRSKLDNGLTDDLSSVKLGENHFRDYIYIALLQNDDKWAEDFLNKYSPVLPEPIRENNINTALAFINYHRKNYSDAIIYIKKVKRNYYINDLDFYTIQIFSYFDLGNIVECLRIKSRFQEYVKKNTQMSDEYKIGIINFIKILSYLISFKENGKRNNLEDLEYNIQNTKKLFWRNWLTIKLKELKNRSSRTTL
ncbi:MAG: hypothetical protein KDD00_03590 [Ignavibacteriae bacterium]|nr:hypothetical protein [Ignavibacteriota bacterium]